MSDLTETNNDVCMTSNIHEIHILSFTEKLFTSNTINICCHISYPFSVSKRLIDFLYKLVLLNPYPVIKSNY